MEMNFQIAKSLKNIFSTSKKRWEKAQTEELKFWDGISKTGYNNLTPEEFIESGQRADMLSAINFLEFDPNYWSDKTVIEFGSGPAGVIEYIDAKVRIAIEPLIENYREIFPHLKNSTVRYLNSSAENIDIIESNSADLAICYNMLDHVIEPDAVLKEIKRVVKNNSTLLFQINVYDSAEDIQNKTGTHAELHPHSFTRDSIVAKLNKFGFAIKKEDLSPYKNDCGEKFFICSCKN